MGTADFSFFTWINVNDFSGINGITSGSNGSFAFYIDNSNGKLVVDKRGIVNVGSSSSSISSGKFTCVGYTRSGTTGTFYINGIASGTATDSQDYTVATQFYGSINPITQNPLRGTLLTPYFYNRALSAAEVVALYEAGVPKGADYNGATNTALNTSAFANYSTGYDTFSGASATGFSAVKSTAGNKYAVSGNTRTVLKGQRYRVTFTLTINSGSGPAQVFLAKPGSGATTDVFVPAAGANSFEMTINQVAAYDANQLFFGSTANGDFAVSSISWTPLGLLLAPDAGQAGGGLTWYDTSGNAANITLPASGVSWNVPTSSKTATGWTFGGNLTVSGTGSNYFEAANLNPPALGSTGGSMKMLYQSQYGLISGVAGAGYGWMQVQRVDGTATAYSLVLQPNGGNLLLGTTTDSGNGKLQLASHTTSAGGIGFGTETSLYRGAGGNLCLNDTGTNAAFSLCNAGTKRADFYAQGSTSTLIIGPITAGWSTVLMSGAGTTALTLDSSQRCILAGALRLNNAYVAGAPTATGYVTIQDSAGTTYKVLVST